VEDSKADIRLIQEALKTSTVPHELVIVRDGVNAMDYLRREGEYLDSPRPKRSQFKKNSRGGFNHFSQRGGYFL
jgi:hypothetical protein